MAEPAKIAAEAHETAPGHATEQGITFRSVAVGLGGAGAAHAAVGAAVQAAAAAGGPH